MEVDEVARNKDVPKAKLPLKPTVTEVLLHKVVEELRS